MQLNIKMKVKKKNLKVIHVYTYAYQLISLQVLSSKSRFHLRFLLQRDKHQLLRNNPANRKWSINETNNKTNN